MSEMCVCCGEPIPEGGMVCLQCVRDIEEKRRKRLAGVDPDRYLPRLMTLKEVLDPEWDTGMWMEVWGVTGYTGFVTVRRSGNALTVHRIDSAPVLVSESAYGTVWRCWTAKPTKKMMEEAVWK